MKRDTLMSVMFGLFASLLFGFGVYVYAAADSQRRGEKAEPIVTWEKTPASAMAKANPFARTRPRDFRVHQCVTLKEELKDRMKAYGSYINWSAVANAAWESVLHDIAASTKGDRHERVMEGLGKALERLRAEKPAGPALLKGE